MGTVCDEDGNVAPGQRFHAVAAGILENHDPSRVKDYYFYVFTKLSGWHEAGAGEIVQIKGPNEALLFLDDEQASSSFQDGDISELSAVDVSTRSEAPVTHDVQESAGNIV